jgi:peptide-methionine (S)-S-oxide reductase
LRGIEVNVKRFVPAFLLLLTFCRGHAEQTAPPRPGLATAVFAGGCFWCMEPAFEHVQGVVSATSGYTGGHTENPSYEDVSFGSTGHYEAVEVLYDPKQVTYAQLLDVFWRNIDPLNADGQFCDEGEQYRSAIFYGNDAERMLAERSRQRLIDTKHWTIATTVRPRVAFYRAEEYHQDYYRKNPVRYKFYRFNCGRDRRLAQLWGDATRD